MGRLAWFPKWIVVPAIAAALGYWFVGPHYAGKLPALPALHTPPSPAPAPVAETSAPTVTVGVRPVGEPSRTEEAVKPEETPRRRRRRRHREPALDSTPAASSATPVPAPDPASTPGSGPDPASTPEG